MTVSAITSVRQVPLPGILRSLPKSMMLNVDGVGVGDAVGVGEDVGLAVGVADGVLVGITNGMKVGVTLGEIPGRGVA